MSRTMSGTFTAETKAQAAAIRAGQWEAIDREHVAEEIESLGIADEHAITSQMQRLLLHLLKWTYQPTHRSPNWRRSIAQTRDAITDRIERSPTLQNYPASRLTLCYRRARRDAATDTGLPLETFPAICLWQLDKVLDEDYYPEG